MPKLLDYGDYPVIYSDGIGDLQEGRSNVRMLQFVWRKIEGIWQPVIAAMIVRPRHTVTLEAKTAMEIALAAQPSASAEAAAGLRH